MGLHGITPLRHRAALHPGEMCGAVTTH